MLMLINKYYLALDMGHSSNCHIKYLLQDWIFLKSYQYNKLGKTLEIESAFLKQQQQQEIA